MNKTITNVNLHKSVGYADPVFADDTLTLAGADTIAQGTILARDSSSGKLVLFVKGGSTNENGIPKAVLHNEVVAAGSGDQPVRVLKAGRVLKNYLIIDADGDNSAVDAAVEDQLRDYGIVVEKALDSSSYEA